MTRKTAAVALWTLLFSGCALWDETVNGDVEKRVRQNVPFGSKMSSAESELAGQGFVCSHRAGPYNGNDGFVYRVDNYLTCTRRPGVISFQCENRDQVAVIPKGEVVDRVEISHSPSCIKP